MTWMGVVLTLALTTTALQGALFYLQVAMSILMSLSSGGMALVSDLQAKRAAEHKHTAELHIARHDRAADTQAHNELVASLRKARRAVFWRRSE